MKKYFLSLTVIALCNLGATAQAVAQQAISGRFSPNSAVHDLRKSANQAFLKPAGQDSSQSPNQTGGQSATQTPSQQNSISGPSTSTDAATEQNVRQARDILDKCIVALGGPAYLHWVDWEMKGRGFGFYNNESTGVGLAFHEFFRYPDKARLELLKRGEWVIIHNGDQGYETTFRGTRRLDDKETRAYNRRRPYALDTVLREWYADPKTALFYDGQTLVDTRQVNKVTLMNAQNLSVRLFIDVKTSLPVRRSFTYRDEQTRDQMEEVELYDEWRPEDGIETAHKLARLRNGEMNSQQFISYVHYNVNTTDAMFTPPPVKYNIKKK